MSVTMRRVETGIAACALALCAASSAAQAKFPDHPVRIIVGYAPGGGSDRLSRIVAQALSEKWGQPVVVENKAGSSGILADDLVAHAPPDGYTLNWVTNDFTVAESLGMKLNFDPATALAPVTQVGYTPDVFVVAPTLGINTLKDLIALAKSKPGQLNFGSPGYGSAPEIETAVLMKQEGIEMLHVPFSGGAAVIAAILGGEIHLYSAAIGTAAPQVLGGKLKALATSSDKRAALLPDVPTVSEALGLKSFEADNLDWNGMAVTGGTSKEIIAQIHADTVAALGTPAVQKQIADAGFVPVLDTPEHFGATLKTLRERWPPLLKTIRNK